MLQGLRSASRTYAVTGKCPVTSREILTRLRLTERQFAGLDDDVVVWCPHCRDMHGLRPEELVLPVWR